MSDPNDIDYDVWCDPNNPRLIKFEDIQTAAKNIEGTIIRTPCTRSHLSEKLGIELYFKQENMQLTGSFKERGVSNALILLSEEQKKIGVIAASCGNHANAMSHHATVKGIPVIVVVPAFTPTGKVTRCEGFGAKVLLHGKSIAEAKHFAMTVAKDKHFQYINGFDHPNVCEGQGTIAIELVEQLGDFDAVLLPVGGGSLLAGVATAIKAMKPHCEVYGAESNKTCSMAESFKNNERTFITVGESTIADGLGVNLVGVNAFHTAKRYTDKMLVVTEDWVAQAHTNIFESDRIIVEGSGCLGLACIMAGLLPHLKGKRVVCVLTGGNIVPAVLRVVIERGLSAEGRLVKFKVVISDRPGSMAELCNLVSSVGVNIKDIVTERVWVKGDIFSIEVRVVVESKGWVQTNELVEQIKKRYREFQFQGVGDRPGASGIRRGPCLAANPSCVKN